MLSISTHGNCLLLSDVGTWFTLLQAKCELGSVVEAWKRGDNAGHPGFQLWLEEACFVEHENT
jgi:uncharacterized membrane protein YhdT